MLLTSSVLDRKATCYILSETFAIFGMNVLNFKNNRVSHHVLSKNVLHTVVSDSSV